MLNHIFQDRDIWKKDTFNLLKNSLLSIKDNRFVQYKQKGTTNFVCLFGNSQVGKTTLILNMIGLKDEECKKEVSKILRGGVSRGNSSTSTAIIYSQSDSDLYGVGIQTLDGQKCTDMQYYTPDGMISRLQSIRNDVENNLFSARNILHIYIPIKYFSASLTKNKISILDLPGVESRNNLEKSHVENLMARYIPLSSVCIIACPANNIQYLEKIVLPNNIDWKYFHNKYIVVLTRSYSDGSIKKYFDRPRSERTEGFYKFIIKRYKTELSKVLGTENKTEVFPLDMGDSFEQLVTKELHNDEDRNEVCNTRNSILSLLQESIAKREGENLLSTINELRTIVNVSDEKKILQIEESNCQLEKSKKDCHIKLEMINKNLESYNSNRDENEREFNILKKLASDIEIELHTATLEFSQSLINEINQKIKEKALKKDKNGKTYFCDKEKIVLKTIRSFITENMNTYIVKETKKSMEGHKFSDINVQNIVNIIDDIFTSQYEIKLYPPPSGILDKIFGDGCKISLDQALIYIKNIEEIIKSSIQSNVIDICKKGIEHEMAEPSENVKNINNQIKIINKRKKSIEKEIEDIHIQIDQNEDYIKIVKDQQEHDKKTLNTYLKFAEEAYKRQRYNILKKINSNIQPAEKILYILLLGIIDKDYRTLTNV